MRSWSVPEQWANADNLAQEIQTRRVELEPRPMRRQPLRRSGGFIQIENIFAELDAAADDDFDPGTSQH